MPTERSMPAVRMTNVMPTVTTPSMEVWRRMLRTFRSDTKLGGKQGPDRHNDEESDDGLRRSDPACPGQALGTST